MPRHVGIIMDGNGRWAEQRGRPRHDGHAKGSDSVRAVVTAAREVGIEALTLYAFSSQNWARPVEEVAGLMDLLFEYLGKDEPTLLENDIRLRSIGQVAKLPDLVLERLREVERNTAHSRSMTLTLALSYGGREEILEAVRQIARDVAGGQLSADDLTEQDLERRMLTYGLPPLDLVIRTSGEMRLSNFLLWQVAYAELFVTDVLWPDFGKPELMAAIESYRRRQRRYGLTGRQVAAEWAEAE